MSQTKSLSLRVKILLLLTLLPLMVLGSYLFIAIGVFQDDKIAYVYEGITSISRTLGQQATTDMNSTLISVKPVLQDFLQNKKFGTLSQEILAGSNIVWVAALGQNQTGRFEEKDIISQDDETSRNEMAQIMAVPGLVDSIYYSKRMAAIPLAEDRVLIGELVEDTANNQRWVFLVFFKSDQLFQAFRTPGGTENFLIDSRGKVLIGPAGKENQMINEMFGVSFVGSDANSPQNGTEEAMNAQGEPILVSFSKVGFGSMTVVSAVPKKAALQAVSTLIRKSMIFFVLLISATVVIGLVASKNLTGALTQLFQATQKVAQGRFDIRVKVNSKDEVGSLAASFNTMAEEVSRLMSETAEKARMESELKTAQTVQETLFPPVSAQIGDLSVHGYYEPASECGGDWWHYNWVDGKVFLWIGDATGHGAPAALITSAAKSASTVIESLRVDPATALDLLNRSIYDISKGKIMMTFFLACYDTKTKVLTYANASHESPYLIRKGEAPPKKKDLIPLNEVNNPRLGQDRETKFEQTTIELAEGDRILFYTDGIPDIQNPQKESWGEREFLKAVIETNKEYPPIGDAVSNLAHKFQEHRQNAPLIDDITFFMAEIRGS